MLSTNILYPDQARQNVGPDQDPNNLTRIVLLKEFFEKVDFYNNKNEQMTEIEKSMQNYPAGKEFK